MINNVLGKMSEGHLEGVVGRTSRLFTDLLNIRDRLEKKRRQVFGSWPEKPSNEAIRPVNPSGMLDQ